MFNVHTVIRLKSFATWCVLGGCLFCLPNSVQSATSDSATLQWAANQESNLAGYRIYRGTNPGVYGVPTTVGKITAYQYTNLLTDKTHYFTITAFDASGNESLPSPEVKKYIPNSSISSGSSAPPAPLARSGWVVWVDSEETAGENGRGTNVIDGKTSTFWHTHWSGGSAPPPPHSLVVDLGAVATMGGFRALPRSDSANGRIGQYEFYIKTNSGTRPTTPPVLSEWTLVTSGTFPNTTSEQQVLFGSVTSRYVWLRARSEAQGSNYPWTSLAEFNVLGTLSQKTPSTPTATSNVLWRNTSSGEVAVWRMNGLTITSVGFPGSTSTDWNIEQVGDMNGDGEGDILWQNTISGVVGIWLMKEGTIHSSGFLGGVSAEWVIKGIGDVNGDGKADVLWRNSSSGMVAVWFMDGLSITSVGYLGSAPTVWQIEQVGDVNGDGKADLVWQNRTNGTVAVWLMNGLTITSVGFPASTSSDWEIQFLGDINGDSKRDVIWRNKKSGMVSVWLMNGATIASSGFLGGVPLEWEIKQVSDANGDGKGDVILQNLTNGKVAVWLMDGLKINSVGFPGSTPVNWEIQK